MPGMMRSRKSGCLCRDCDGPQMANRANEKRTWQRTERAQFAPWEPLPGDVRKRIGPHWLEPDWLLYGYWQSIREDDGFLNEDARPHLAHIEES
jgi:hypothetical protein